MCPAEWESDLRMINFILHAHKLTCYHKAYYTNIVHIIIYNSQSYTDGESCAFIFVEKKALWFHERSHHIQKIHAINVASQTTVEYRVALKTAHSLKYNRKFDGSNGR